MDYDAGMMEPVAAHQGALETCLRGLEQKYPRGTAERSDVTTTREGWRQGDLKERSE